MQCRERRETSDMNDFSAYVGGRIRLYRQMKQYTIATLADMIHKSKSTLSKYENGEITLDIVTLLEIARALDIGVQQLVDYPPESEKKKREGFFPERQIFVYFYDGRRGKIVRNLLETGTDSTATFYNDVPDLSHPEECRNLYFGTVDYYDTITNFSLDSQSNRIERLTLCAANPFDRGEQVLGMLSGLSRYPMLPVSIKCVLSPKPLPENAEMREKLILSPKDIKLIRSLNMFAVEQRG